MEIIGSCMQKFLKLRIKTSSGTQQLAIYIGRKMQKKGKKKRVLSYLKTKNQSIDQFAKLEYLSRHIIS